MLKSIKFKYIIYNITKMNKVSKKYKQVVKLTKNHRKYHVIMLGLFINKIMQYEPELVVLIAYLHDLNYTSLLPMPPDERRPIRRNACLGLFKPELYDRDDFYCVCVSCDPYGEYMLKPYRIENKLREKINKEDMFL